MDYEFLITLVINIAGLGFMGWQIHLMKKQMELAPSPRSARRTEFEQRLNRRLYFPVLIMAGLVLLSWLPFVIAAVKPVPLPAFVAGWGGALDGCNAAIDTSGFAKAADKYRMFLVCHIMDSTVDQMEDDRIAVSKPFQITGGLVSILIPYGPSDPIRSVAKVGTQTGITVVLLPKDLDGTTIKRLSDVGKEGGQVLLPGGKLKD